MCLCHRNLLGLWGGYYQKEITSNKVLFRIMTFKIREFSFSDSKYYHSDVILNIPSYVIGELVVFRKLSKAPSKKQAPLPFVKWPKWCFPYNCCQARRGLANILKGKKIFSKNPILGRQVEQIPSSFYWTKFDDFLKKKKLSYYHDTFQCGSHCNTHMYSSCMDSENSCVFISGKKDFRQIDLIN